MHAEETESASPMHSTDEVLDNGTAQDKAETVASGNASDEITKEARRIIARCMRNRRLLR